MRRKHLLIIISPTLSTFSINRLTRLTPPGKRSEKNIRTCSNCSSLISARKRTASSLRPRCSSRSSRASSISPTKISRRSPTRYFSGPNSSSSKSRPKFRSSSQITVSPSTSNFSRCRSTPVSNKI